MASSKRYTTTKEERINMVLAKKNTKNSFTNTDKLTNYLSQPNVKKFNAIIVDKALNRVNKRHTLNSVEECQSELKEYFTLCYDNNMIPSIASLCCYLGINRDTLYNLASSHTEYSDSLQNAITICHSYLETGTLSGSIAPLLMIFLGKNYYNMKDDSIVNLTTAITQNNTPTQTMNAIREQMELENSKNS